jgi:hypothetical protein
MPQAPVAPVAPKLECWFEFHRAGLKAALKEGIRRPERIFSSDDERWALIEELSKKAPLYGNLIVGSVKRDGEDFVEGTIKIRTHLTSQRSDKAREKMRLFETDGRWGTTQYADAMREAEDAKKRGEEQSERLTKAMETLASNLSKSGAGK